MKPEIYDVLAALAGDRPAEATSKFSSLLQDRIDQAIKDHQEKVLLMRQREENPEVLPPDENLPPVLDADQLGTTVPNETIEPEPELEDQIDGAS